MDVVIRSLNLPQACQIWCISDVCTNLYKCFAALGEIKTLEAQEFAQKKEQLFFLVPKDLVLLV